MITPAETPIAVVALEGFLSCMLASVTRKFVAASELPCAALPFTDVRFLSGVSSSVCL